VRSLLNTIVVLSFLSIAVFAEDKSEGPIWDKDGMMGVDTLQAVYVSMTPILRNHITDARLKTIIELELRKYGIVVLANDGWRHPHLTLHLNAVRAVKTNGVVYSYAVAATFEFARTVVLSYDPFVVTRATTWESDWVFYWGADRVKDASVDFARTVADEFINAHLAANPRN
jgi:hypothetical protein